MLKKVNSKTAKKSSKKLNAKKIKANNPKVTKTPENN